MKKRVKINGGTVRAERRTSAKRSITQKRLRAVLSKSVARKKNSWDEELVKASGQMAKEGQSIPFEISVDMFPPETIQSMVKFCERVEREEIRKNART